MALARNVRRKPILYGGILLTLLALLLLFFFFYWREKPKASPVYVVYTALIETDARTAEHLKVGDALTDSRTKEPVGEILGLTKEPTLCEDAFGVYSHPTRVTLAVRIGAQGERSEEGVRIGMLTPRVGEQLYLYGRARVAGVCIGVRAV